MRMPNYPAGVPNPLTRHWHPYPTRYHGTIYTRPVYGFPFADNPVNLPMPRDYAGLGDYDISRGIFQPGGYGGGVFDGNLSGLGATTSASTCIASYCKDLSPEQMQTCIDACNAQAKATPGATAPPSSVPISVPKTTPSAEAAAQASLYSPSSDNKWLAFAVGGAAALGVLIYLKKRKKKG